MEKPKQPTKSWPEPSPLLQEERWQDSIEIESWMNATGDVDDFIFYPEEEFLKYHSER